VEGKFKVTMTKIQSLFARLVLVLSVLFAAAPMVGCNENKLPDMHMVGDNKPVTTGQYNITRAAERNWYASINTTEYVMCWGIIMFLPWVIFFGISGWMFGKFEKPGEIIALVVGTALMWRWASMLDLEPWLLICWIAPCIVYVFLKGEEMKMKVFFVPTMVYILWSAWMVGKALLQAFTYHPILMASLMFVILIVFANMGDDNKEAAHSDHH
jgi:hypothetical protein